MDRRAFVGGIVSAAAAAGAVSALGRSGSAPDPGPGPDPRPSGRLPDRWGLQLYTLRGRMQEDVEGTLRAVAGLGYGEVEFAGLFGRDPYALRSTLDGLGLRAASSHIPLEEAVSGVEPHLEAARILGQSQVVVPYLPESQRSRDGYARLATTLNRAGEKAREYELELGYHNHDFELRPITPDEESVPLDVLFARTDPGLVTFQLDLFWTAHAGADPLAWFRRHPGRFRSVHAKDRAEDGRMVAVGDGALDFGALLPAAEAAGVRHVFVEHDNPANPLRSVERSIRHLEGLR